MGRLLLAIGVVTILPAAPSGYSSSHSCDACHPGIAARYWKSPMGNSFARVTDSNTQPGSFVHEKSKRQYEVLRLATEWFQSRVTLAAPAFPFKQQMTHVVGSGSHARTYLNLSSSGGWTQLPLTWYRESNSWAMSPGYDRTRHYDFSRPVDPGCLQCHAASPEPSQTEPRGPIDCQSCHGPGQSHIAAATSGLPLASIRAAVVNPKSLSASLQRDVCYQCHWQSTSQPLPHALPKQGLTLSSFRPGKPLSDSLVQFEPTNASLTLEVNSHGFRLAQSPCYQKSTSPLGCTTCHNSHGSTDPRQAHRDACLGCHQPHRESGRDDCSGCHMPRRQTSDAIHITMTDHRIVRTPAPGPSRLLTEPEADPVLRPRLSFPATLTKPEQDYYLGLALTMRGATRQEGLAMIRRSGLKAPLPRNSLAQSALTNGATALASGHVTAARRLFQQATQYPETATDAWNNLAFLDLNAGDHTSARASLEKALGLTPDHADALNNLGRLLAAEGDLEGALTALNAAIAADPSFKAARENRDRVLQFRKAQP